MAERREQKINLSKRDHKDGPKQVKDQRGKGGIFLQVLSWVKQDVFHDEVSSVIGISNRIEWWVFGELLVHIELFITKVRQDEVPTA